MYTSNRLQCRLEGDNPRTAGGVRVVAASGTADDNLVSELIAGPAKVRNRRSNS